MSQLSETPLFKPVANFGSPIYDVAHRVFAVSKDRSYASGTAVSIGGNLFLTARHVIEDFQQKLGTDNYNLWIIQITNDGDKYAVWDTKMIYCHASSDLALIHTYPYNQKAADMRKTKACKQTLLQLSAPQVGETVTGFGFSSPKTSVSLNPDGTFHYDVNDKPHVTEGVVAKVYPEMRDKSHLNWPCYQVDFKSEGGMSGGPIFTKQGRLCGVITAGFQDDFIAHATTLWPILGLGLDIDRGEPYPKDSKYQFFQLILDGFIGAVDLHKYIVKAPPPKQPGRATA